MYLCLKGNSVCAAGRVRGLKGHRWLIAACETKILMTDLASQAIREIPRAVLDGRAPTSLAFLYKCSALLLGSPSNSVLAHSQKNFNALWQNCIEFFAGRLLGSMKR